MRESQAVNLAHLPLLQLSPNQVQFSNMQDQFRFVASKGLFLQILNRTDKGYLAQSLFALALQFCHTASECDLDLHRSSIFLPAGQHIGQKRNRAMSCLL